VPHVDIELEGHGKLVVHEPRGNEDALRIAQAQVAMADRIVAQRDVVTVGDDRLFSLIHGERDEVISLALERGGDAPGHGRDHALQVKGVHRDFAAHGIADSVGRLRNWCCPNDFSGAPRNSGRCLRHS
jgi:hypothetical protein